MTAATRPIRAKPDSRARGWALVWVAFGASLWGTDAVLRRPLGADLISTQIVLIEHLILLAVLAPVLAARRREWLALGLREWGAAIAIGWGGSALGTILFTNAIRSGNPTAAVLLQKTQPLFAALAARLLLGELLGRRFWAYLGAALAGAYLVSFGWRFPSQGLAALAFAPSIQALAAAALWGSSTALGRFVLGRVSFVTLTSLRIATAAPLLMVLGAQAGALLPARLEARQAVSLLALALVPGLAALLAYYRGLRHARASLAAIAELSFPAVATLLNWIFLGATISAAQAAGFAIIWAVILRIRRG